MKDKKIGCLERNHAIDLMKFLAAILITYSHMGSLFPEKYEMLSTGGAIGDTLFFFCSGFCLMMGSRTDFLNWYKRRINRIFPALFAVALIEIVFRGGDPTLKHVIIRRGGWFIQAIFVFYFVFWFVKRFLFDKLWIAFAIDTVLVLVWYLLFWDWSVFILEDATYLRWPCFFMVMLLGAVIRRCSMDKDTNEVSGWLYLGLLVVLLLFYYGYQLLWSRFPVLMDFQVVLLPALYGITFAIYKLCSNEKVLKVYNNKNIKWALYGISACCLEIYLCGGWSFGIGRNLICLFPLNIVVTFLLIFVVAYFVKIVSNFLSQTFKTEQYDWKAMIKL